MSVNIISVIILLGVLIFVHEFGHFIVAKACGVSVLKFSLGFGPRLVGKTVGETDYRVSLIPLGGYVKMLGEDSNDRVDEADETRSFSGQPVWKRILIVGAGPSFNFLFAIVAFTLIYSFGITTLTARVGDVKQPSAAYEAGIQKDDIILSIDGKDINDWSALAETISTRGGKRLKMMVERKDRLLELFVTPRAVTTENLFGEEIKTYRIGITASSEVTVEHVNPFRAFMIGCQETWFIFKITILSIVKMIQGVVSPKTVGGPILIAQMAGSQVKQGLVPFIFFMSVLSVNLGVLNLLPIPVLDGGHLLFFLIELVTRRQINVKWREIAQQVGFYILIAIMLFVFYNDIVKIVSE